MVDSNNSIPGAAGPVLPADKLPLIPSEAQLNASETATGGGDMSNSPWAKMFPAGATKEELNQFIQMYLRSVVRQMNHDDKIHKENLDKQKTREEGGVA